MCNSERKVMCMSSRFWMLELHSFCFFYIFCFNEEKNIGNGRKVLKMFVIPLMSWHSKHEANEWGSLVFVNCSWKCFCYSLDA